MEAFTGKYTNAFAAFGLFFLGWKALRFTIPLLGFLYARFLRPAKNLKSTYGSWAVVTGATDGIGKAYAIELAKRKMNVVLVSRTKAKLDEVANELAAFNVSTKVIVADFNDGWNLQNTITQQLAGLEIGVLINNVGISYEYPEFYNEVPEETVQRLVTLNMTSVLLMTRAVLPGMTERKKGAIVNISSASGMQPTPLLSVYGASKAFVDHLSQALHAEYAAKGIFIQSLMPFFVASKMSKMRPSLTVPDAQSYVFQALNTLGYDNVTNGYLMHNIMAYTTSLLPHNYFISKLMSINLGLRKKYFARQERLKEKKAE